MCCCCVFFFKQKTAYEMRISDWSSDVCSSDLFTPTRVLDTVLREISFGGFDESPPDVRLAPFRPCRGGFLASLRPTENVQAVAPCPAVDSFGYRDYQSTERHKVDARCQPALGRENITHMTSQIAWSHHTSAH